MFPLCRTLFRSNCIFSKAGRYVHETLAPQCLHGCIFFIYRRNLTLSLPDAYYISVNEKYDFLPEQIEDKGIAILGDIGIVLRDVKDAIK